MSKPVFSNILNNLVSTLINVVAPLIIIPLLTSALGVEGYGTYVALVAKAALFVVLTELGLDMYLGKVVSENRDKICIISSFFWVFLAIRIIAFMLLFFAYSILSNSLDIFDVLLLMFIFPQVINVAPILMGLEQYKFLTQVQVFTRVMMIALFLTVNFSSFGVEKAISIQIFIMTITTGSYLIYFFRNNKVEKYKFDLNLFKSMLSGCLPFYGAKFFVNVYRQSSTYFVSLLLALDLVAIYSIVMQLYKVGEAVIGSVARVLYTSTARTKNFNLVKRLTIYSIVIHLMILPIVIFFGEDILSLIFKFDVGLLYELSLYVYISLIFAIISSYWGYPVLCALNKENCAHLGVLVASCAYFLAFGVAMVLDNISIYTMIMCIIFAEITGMLIKIYFACKFKVFKYGRKEV